MNQVAEKIELETKHDFDRGLEVINKWAKSNECVGIEGIGRAGFWNWIKDRQGWEKTAIFFEYEFKENE
jgi:hypothetical protein